MRVTTRLVCAFVVFVLAMSMAAVAVSVPASSASGPGPLEKMEPDLRELVQASAGHGKTQAMKVILFLKDGADVDLAGREMAKKGAAVGGSYGALGACAVELDADIAIAVASMDSVETMLLDEMKYRLPAETDSVAFAAGAASDEPQIETSDVPVWWASTSAEMGAEAVWAEDVTGEGVTVAVLDTGCDITQTDLKDAVFDYKSFTSEEFHDVQTHGTATAGLVASRGVNNYVIPQFDGVVKMKGMAPGARLMTGKVLDDTGYGWDSWIIGGIEWAATGDDGEPMTGDEAQIISMSLGGMEVPNDGVDPTALALDIVAEKYGIISVLSAGNEGMGQSTTGTAGVAKSVITVGASTLNAECQLIKYWPLSDFDAVNLVVKEGEAGYENNHVIWWSSRGPSADGRIDPDICAAGAWGPSTQPGNTITMQFGGTSMAAPVVAGTVALLYQAFEEKNGVAPTPDQMKSILMGTALDMGYGPNEQGPGRADAYAAYEAIMAGWQAPGPASVALDIAAGSSASVSFADDTVIGSKAIVPSGTTDWEFSDTATKGVDQWFDFTVADGEEYIMIDLAFDQKAIFSRDVHTLYSTGGYNDNHINLVLYRLDEKGERTLVNYAYSHSNTQELNAKVAAGTYQLRVSPVINNGMYIGYDVGVKFFKTAEWSWFGADGSTATISVPAGATPGIHSAFLTTSYDGIESLVPVAVDVPVTVGVPFEDVADVGHTVSYFNEGDWKYYSIPVPEDGSMAALTTVVTWTDYDTDIDQYLISPSGVVIVMSVTPYLGAGMFGPWTTSSGTTADVLTVLDPEPGIWQLATHVVLMGRVLQEKVGVVALPYTAAEFTSERICVKPGGIFVPATVENNLDCPVMVGLKPVKTTTVTASTVYTGTISSIDLGGTGATEVLFDVQPLTLSLTVSMEWFDESADFDVVLYGADWSNRGIIWENDDSLTVDQPVCGEWDAAVALKNSASEAEFVLTVTMVYYEPWSELKLSAYSLALDPDGSGTVSVSMKGSVTCFKGMIIAYDLVTGCEYDRLLVNGKQ